MQGNPRSFFLVGQPQAASGQIVHWPLLETSAGARSRGLVAGGPHDSVASLAGTVGIGFFMSHGATSVVPMNGNRR